MSRPDTIPLFQRVLWLVFGIPVAMAAGFVLAVGFMVIAFTGRKSDGERLMKWMGL